MSISPRIPQFLADRIRAVGLADLEWFSANNGEENPARATARVTDRVQLGIAAKRGAHASSAGMVFAEVEITDPTVTEITDPFMACTAMADAAKPFLIYAEIDAEIERRRADLAELEEARHRLVMSQRAAGLDPPKLAPWASVPYDAPHAAQDHPAVDWRAVATETTLDPALAERVAGEVAEMFADVEHGDDAADPEQPDSIDKPWTTGDPFPF